MALGRLNAANQAESAPGKTLPFNLERAFAPGPVAIGPADLLAMFVGGPESISWSKRGSSMD
jgi:hypothetical protein